MAQASYYGWVPPTNQTATYTNCTAAATWLASFLNNVNGDSGTGATATTTYEYLVSLVPSDLDTPTVGQAAEWYANMSDSDMSDAIVNYPAYLCPQEFCTSLVWAGDADLAGIGVVIVFYLAAVLTMMYFVLLSIDQWSPFRRMATSHRRWTWLVGAFNESLPGFLDTALVFSISMNASAVYRHGSSRMHPDKTHSIYQLTNGTYIGIFTIFPPLMLQLVTHHRRRMRIRTALWLAIIGLAAANVGLYYSLATSSSRLSILLDRLSALSDLLWESNCDPRRLRDALDDALYAACALLALNLVVWAYHTFQPTRTRDHIRRAVLARSRFGAKAQQVTQHGRTWWENVQRVAKIVDGSLCAVLMWALLGLYTAYRSAVTKAMGDDNANIQWSFGQVLALATWVPVIFDLVTIYIYGAKDTLEGKVSETFRIVENDEKDVAALYSKGAEAAVRYQSTGLDPYQVVDPRYCNSPPDETFARRGLLRGGNGTP